MGLYAANTMGDGNCLFRALSDQLYGYPHQHSALREQVCDYLASKPEKFAAFIDVEKPFEDYVRTMRQSGTYGGHLELSAFAQLQQKQIKIVQPGLVYIVSGDDESPQATKERERRERDREIAQSKTAPGSEGPPPTERELRRLRRERKTKGLEDRSNLAKAGESSAMALQKEEEDQIDTLQESTSKEAVVEAFGPLYIAYHNWEHYSSIRNIVGPHTGLPRIEELTSSAEKAAKPAPEESLLSTEPTDEEALVLRSTSGYSIEQVRFYIKRHGGWEEALEAILAQGAIVDDDETEDEEFTKVIPSVMSSPDDAARADEAAGPSQPRGFASPISLTGRSPDFYTHPPIPDHLRDWRAASPSSVDTAGTHSSAEGGSTSTHATTDESPETAILHQSSSKTLKQDALKRSKRAASKDPTQVLRSPKRRSRSRSPMQPVLTPNEIDAGTLAAQEIDALHVCGTPTEVLETPPLAHPVKEPSRLRASTTKTMSMRERREARLEERARKSISKNRRRDKAIGGTTSVDEKEPSAHYRSFIELRI